MSHKILTLFIIILCVFLHNIHLSVCQFSPYSTLFLLTLRILATKLRWIVYKIFYWNRTVVCVLWILHFKKFHVCTVNTVLTRKYLHYVIDFNLMLLKFSWSYIYMNEEGFMYLCTKKNMLNYSFDISNGNLFGNTQNAINILRFL